MDLLDKIQDIANKVKKLGESLQTEEATKNALIMPFISALGYDVFDPSEVIPEFVADVGIKKGEKVDYAVKKDDKVIFLIECKRSIASLSNNHASQLHRYFHVTSARFGILTNGIEYRFYSDLEQPNKMDEKPFFIFNMLNYKEHQINELKKFSKTTFSLDEIVNTASKLKYVNAIKHILNEELEEPSESFVKFFASQIYSGRITQTRADQFTKIVKNAFSQFIKSKISESFETALSKNEENENQENIDEEINLVEKEDGIVTTEEEIEGYHIIKAVLRNDVDVKRIAMRDTKSYCGILLDDNNRKPICRLQFNSSNHYISIFSNKVEEKIPIEKLEDIYKYSEKLKNTVKEYDSKK